MNDSPPSPTPPGVLVVDDEECIRTLLHFALQQAGFRVLLAADGPDALLLLAAASGPLHVAVVDRHMPGMSGEETAAALRGVCPGMPCLLVGGEPPDGELPEGCADFLQKPFRMAELAARLRALIRTGRVSPMP